MDRNKIYLLVAIFIFVSVPFKIFAYESSAQVKGWMQNLQDHIDELRTELKMKQKKLAEGQFANSDEKKKLENDVRYLSEVWIPKEEKQMNEYKVEYEEKIKQENLILATPTPSQNIRLKVVRFEGNKVVIADSNGVTQTQDFEQFDPLSEMQPLMATYQSDSAGNSTERGRLEIQEYQIKVRQSSNRKELVDNIFSLHRWGTGNPDDARMVELRMALYQIAGINFKKYVLLHIDYMNMYHELLNYSGSKAPGFVGANRTYQKLQDDLKKCLLTLKN